MISHGLIIKMKRPGINEKEVGGGGGELRLRYEQVKEPALKEQADDDDDEEEEDEEDNHAGRGPGGAKSALGGGHEGGSKRLKARLLALEAHGLSLGIDIRSLPALKVIRKPLRSTITS